MVLLLRHSEAFHVRASFRPLSYWPLSSSISSEEIRTRLKQQTERLQAKDRQSPALTVEVSEFSVPLFPNENVVVSDGFHFPSNNILFDPLLPLF